MNGTEGSDNNRPYSYDDLLTLYSGTRKQRDELLDEVEELREKFSRADRAINVAWAEDGWSFSKKALETTEEYLEWIRAKGE